MESKEWLMKFIQFTSYYKSSIYIEKFHEKCDLKTCSRLFFVCKKLSATSTGEWNFPNKLKYYVLLCISRYIRYIKIYQNQHLDFTRFHSTEKSLKTKKELQPSCNGEYWILKNSSSLSHNKPKKNNSPAIIN